jgi:hypothetical protein
VNDINVAFRLYELYLDTTRIIRTGLNLYKFTSNDGRLDFIDSVIDKGRREAEKIMRGE